MKNLLFISVLILIFCAAAFAQTNEISLCPAVKVVDPAGITSPGDTMTFTVNVGQNNFSSISYEWKASAGVIIEGQNSPVIRIATTPEMASEDVAVTVKVKGLPENCASTFSSEQSLITIGCGLLVTLDEYGKISNQEEKARLSYVAFAIKVEPVSAALFIISFTKQESTTSVKARISKISKLMSGTFQVPKKQFKFAFSEGDTHITEIYHLPLEVIDSFSAFEKNLEKLRPSVQPSQKSSARRN